MQDLSQRPDVQSQSGMGGAPVPVQGGAGGYGPGGPNGGAVQGWGQGQQVQGGPPPGQGMVGYK